MYKQEGIVGRKYSFRIREPFQIRRKAMVGKRLLQGVGVLAAIAVVGIATAVLRKGGIGVDAASHSPGVPQPAVALWEEDFETLPYGTPPPLTSDSGKDMYGNGVGYSTDPHFQPSYGNTAFCNGFIVNSATALGVAGVPSDNCDRVAGQNAYGSQKSAWWFAQNLATSLGMAQGSASPAGNNAVVAMTRDNSDDGNNDLMPHNGNTMLRTSNLLVSAGHYYRASAWFASANCVADVSANGGAGAGDFGVGADPKLSVGLYVNNGVIPVVATSPTSPCDGGTRQNPDGAGTRFYTAQYATDIVQISRELSYSSISMELRNTELSVAGNDSAFDLPALHDATPQLDQAFSAPAAAGGAGFTSTLTYTITNTDELAAKPALSFTNTLPYGITPVVESLTSTCANAQMSVSGQQVNFSGALNGGDAACTIMIDVAVQQAGTYVNDVWAFADYANTGHYKPWGLQEPEAATLTVANVAKLELTAATDTNSVDAATQNIVYSFAIKNGGNVAVKNLALGFSGFSGEANSTSPMTCSETPWLGLEDLVLQPGETVECFFTYKATQDDIDRHGGIDLANSVVRGAAATDNSAVQSNAVSLHVAAGATPSLTLKQTAVRANGTAIDAPLTDGEVIKYLFTVANVGAATVKNVTIQETAFSGANSLVIGCPQQTLAPFEIMTCTADYTVSAADVASVSISNTANARGLGTDKIVEVVVTSASDTAELPDVAMPGITIGNSHTPLPAGEVSWAGDELEYIFTVANTGNVPLDDVQITSDVHDNGVPDTLAVDAAAGGKCANYPNLGRLEPGEVVVCKANYTLTQDDIDRGGAIRHTAHVSGDVVSGGGGGLVSADAADDEDAYPVTAPDLTLTRDAPSEVKDGEIDYIYYIHNNGNTTLTGVALSDEVRGADGSAGATLTPTCNWPNADGVLAPGQTATCTAAYELTGKDILAAEPITGTASAVGMDAKGKIASSIATAKTDIVRGAAGTISGHLYMDHNMDWHFEAENNEPRIAGYEIQLRGTDIYGNAVERSVLTNEQGEYIFTDLYPGTYMAVRPRNSYNHISVSSTGGYYQVNADGNPLPSSKNGTGSAQDETVSLDLIENIRIDEGDYNQGNDFGETCGSIGNLIWRDLDRDGYVDEGEPGIEGVEVALYLDANGDGTEDEFIRTTITDVNGNYYFSVLDLNYRDSYLIQITDGNGALAEVGLEPTFTATQTDFHFDNCSSNVVDGVAYADTEIPIVENDAHASWFDWMDGEENPDLMPAMLAAAELRSMARIEASAVQLADDSLVSNNSNLTADFGFMTLAGVDPTNPGETGGESGKDGGGSSEDGGPNVPDTGVLFRVGDFAVRTFDFAVATFALAVLGGGAIWFCRRRF